MTQRQDPGSTAPGSPATPPSRRAFLVGTAGGTVLALTGCAPGAGQLFSGGRSGTAVTTALRLRLTSSSAQGPVVASSSVAVQTFTASAPSGVSVGDLLVAICYDAQGSSQTFTAPSGWSAPSSGASEFIAACGAMYVFYKYATGSDSYAFSGSGSSSDVAIAVLDITGGPASGNPFDAVAYSGIASGPSADTMPGAAATASYTNDLAICVYGGFDAQTIATGPSGMTAGAGASSGGGDVSLYTYWETLSGQYGIIGNRPVTWSAADGVMACTLLVPAASPAAPGGTVYTQRSNSTLLGGETHSTPGNATMTQSLTTADIGDLAIMFIHWTGGGGLAVSSVSSSHVTWASSAAVVSTGSATTYHEEIWYGTVTAATTATVTVSFNAVNNQGTELGFDSWGASPPGNWSVQATGTVDSGSTASQDVTLAQVAATGNGLYWAYDVTDHAAEYGLGGDYGYYFTADNSGEGSPISWRYGLSAATAYQASAWTSGATGRWNGGGAVFEASGTVSGVVTVASSTVVTQTFTATAPSGVNPGDLLVAVCYDAQGSSQTFTAAPGWSAPSGNNSTAAGAGTVYVFYTYATGSDSYAFSGSGSASDVAIAVLDITGGPASGNPFDGIGYWGIASGESAATMPGAAAIASYSNDLAICVYGGSDGQSVSSGPSGMTAGASGSGGHASLYTYYQSLSSQYGIIGNRPVTWSAAEGVMNCTLLIQAASPSSPSGTVYTQQSNSTLLGGETHSTPGATTMTKTLTTVDVGDLVIMYLHWTGGGSLAVSSVSSSHVNWHSSAAVVTKGSVTTYHGEIWYGTVTAVETATVTVTFNGKNSYGTELGFDEWSASAGSTWSVQATATIDSGSTKNQTVTSAQVTPSGNGLLWTYDIIDAQGIFGLTGDYGYWFTQDNYEGSPISFRYDLSAMSYQSSAWTEGGAAPGRWNGGGVVFQKT